MLIPPAAPRPRLARVALGVYLAVVVAAVVLDLRFSGTAGLGRIWVLLGLGAAMPVLMVVLRSAAPRSRTTTATGVALVFSWFGDVLGVSFEIKLGFFLVAQIAYCVAFWPYRGGLRPLVPLLVAYALGIAAVIAFVARDAGPLVVPVIAYGFALGSMAILACGLNRRAAIGGLLFVLSDIELAVNAFVAPGLIREVGALNSAVYLPAQLLLVLGVIERLRTAHRPSAGPG